MADVIENMEHEMGHMTNSKYATRGTGNAALTLGIIGTALGALGTGMGGVKGILGGGNATSSSESKYLERKQCQDYLDITKQYYEGKIAGNERLTNAFFDAYQRDVDNSFKLYKNQRDEDDAIKAQMNANFFQLYQLEQNDKSALADKINDVEKKVDVMAAIRPYQDALIDCKINNNAIIGAYELQKRTCRMIQGELVLPSSPTVTGYPSYSPFNSVAPTSGI